jgi:signal peptidase I
VEENWKKELLEWVKAIAIALAVVFLIKFFIFDFMAIDQISMKPTLYPNDRVFVNILEYKLGSPKRGQVVIFTPPTDPKHYYIKRVIALPGEKVKIDEGRVYIQKVGSDKFELLEEPYLQPDVKTYAKGDYGSMVIDVPQGSLFVMGDNRPYSEDSRMFGPVTIKSVKGHALYRVFPLDKMKKL